MKRAVHHHAMGTDGKLVYVFGGRNISKAVRGNPVNYVQIYNPASNVSTIVIYLKLNGCYSVGDMPADEHRDEPHRRGVE